MLKGGNKVFQVLWATAARGVASLGTQKLIAIHLGPGGIALWNTFQSVFGAALVFTQEGVRRGLTKTLSAEQDVQKRGAWVVASVALTALLTAIIFLPLVFYCFHFAEVHGFITSNTTLSISLLLGLLGQLIYPIWLSYNIAIGQHKKIAVNAWLLALVTVSLTGYGVFMGKIEFAIIAYLLSSFVGGMICIFVEIGKVNSPIQFNAKDLRQKIRVLTPYLYSALAVAIFGKLVDAFVQNYAILNLGKNETGLWTAVAKLSDSYMIPVNAITQQLYFPAIAALSLEALNKERKSYFLKAFGYSSLLGGAFVLTLYLLREPILYATHDQEFVIAQYLCKWQQPGDYLRILSYLPATLLMARGKTGLYTLLELFSATLYITALWQLLPNFGVEAFSMAYLARYLGYAIIVYWFGLKEL